MPPLVDPTKQSGPIDVVKQRWFNVIFSLLLLIPGLYFMVHNIIESPQHAPVKLGIDFVGGTLLEYGFEKKLHQSDLPAIRTVFDAAGYSGAVIQIQNPRKIAAQPQLGEALANKKISAEPAKVDSTETPAISTLLSIRTKPMAQDDLDQLQTHLRDQYGDFVLLQKNAIGPTLANELLTNGLLALVLAYLLIVGYLTFRFQFDYAVCAIVGLVHDTLFVIGVFAMLGYFFHTEVDSLFLTGILTVIGFSVHDTIVVFDRLRENSKIYYSKKLPFSQIANISVNQTLARSINTSLTALLPLITLYVWGGETTKDFVLTMLLGIIVGTYSSICVASMMLVWWRERNNQSPHPTVAATA